MSVSAISTDFSPDAVSFDWGDSCKSAVLTAASIFNEPVCKVREYYYSLSIPCKNLAEKVARVVLFTLGILLFAFAAPFTAPVGAALRGIVAALQTKPHIYQQRAQAAGKTLPENRKISVASHNQCYMPGGYCITDGQVDPGRERMDANIQRIKELNPDIVCLFEVADIRDAQRISKQLADYPFLIPVAGMRAVGPSSMMYIASKYEIEKDSIEFVPFKKGTELTGRARFSEKGYLSFDLKVGATVVATHLQHSEIPAKPVESDEKAREAEMLRIIQHIQNKAALGRAVVFTGDLNQEERELNAFLEKHRIDWLKRDPAVRGKPTWGGDHWCAQLMKKEASGPLVLDYTFAAGRVESIATRIIGTGYCGQEFRRQAGSDHDILYSEIVVGEI